MNLEYLRHGKALCGKVFRRFVETFNFHNDFISNLKGDADLPVVGGKVNVDRTDERHPVIRCQGCGGGGDVPATIPGCFEFRPEGTGGESDPGGFDSPYYSVGARLYAAPNLRDAGAGFAGKVVALVVNLGGSQPVASIVAAYSFSALQSLSADEDVSVRPLYEFDGDGNPVADLRNMPTVVTREFAGS